MTTPLKCLLAAAGLVSLSACGGDPGNESAGATNATKPSPAAWAPLGQCAPSDLGGVAAALGTTVASASLVSQLPGDDTMAATTSCSVTLADGTAMVVLARRSPQDDVTPEAIERARTMGGSMPPGDAVLGVGSHAFWTAKVQTLQVFYDGTRYATITLSANPAKRDAKATAISVAQAIQ